MDIQSAFPAHGELADLVEQREGLFGHVAEFARPLATLGLGSGEDGFGAALLAGLAERRAVLGLVGQQCREPSTVALPSGCGAARDAEPGWKPPDRMDPC